MSQLTKVQLNRHHAVKPNLGYLLRKTGQWWPSLRPLNQHLGKSQPLIGRPTAIDFIHWSSVFKWPTCRNLWKDDWVLVVPLMTTTTATATGSTELLQSSTDPWIQTYQQFISNYHRHAAWGNQVDHNLIPQILFSISTRKTIINLNFTLPGQFHFRLISA